MKEISAIQQGIILTQHIYAGSSLFNVGGYAVIRGNLDVRLLSSAILQVLKDADVLKIGYLIFNDAQIDDNSDAGAPDVSMLDFSDMPDGDSECITWMNDDIRRPFGPLENLIGIHILKSSEYTHYWYVKAHHIIFDGYSMSLFFNNVSQLYTAWLKNTQVEEAIPKYSYSAFIEDEKEYRRSDLYEQDKAFWLQRLEQFAGHEAFQSAMVVNHKTGLHSQRESILLSRALINQVEELGKTVGCSIFHCFIATIFIANKLYGNEDVFIGLPVFNRGNKQFKQTFGAFVNMLPFSVPVNVDETIADVIVKVGKELKSCYKHQRFPLYDLLETLNNGKKIYNITFSYQKNSYGKQLGDCSASIHYMHNGEQQEDLVFHLLEYSPTDDLLFSVDYSTELFSPGLINNLLRHIQAILNLMCADPDAALSTLHFLTEAETQKLLLSFNDTKTEYAHENTIIDLFEKQVRRAPHDIALIYEAKEFTYYMLNEQVNRLAHYLRAKYAIQPDELMGIQLERSEKLVIAILAVLKSGAAYVPIDPLFPPERIAYIKSNSACKGVINEEELFQFEASACQYSGDNPAYVNQPGDLAYVIYTSGSTGKPKGVMVEHRNVVSVMENFSGVYLHPGMTFAATTNYVFDISVLELIGSLLAGMKLVLLSNDDLPQVAWYIESKKIDVLQVTPTILEQLVRVGAGGIELLTKCKLLMVCGEPISPQLYATLKSLPIMVLNGYGPTETTIWSSCLPIHQSNELSIGTPLLNERIYITGQAGQLLPLGVAGEICISGDGVARGYRNEAVLSKERFVPDPFNAGDRLYKTGDLGRWLPNGNIEYLGRKDHQVKIRGYRIELPEIEYALLRHSYVAAAVVVPRPGFNGEKELVAYLVCRQPINISDIRHHLSQILPAFMIPGYYVVLDKLPLTAGGKIDRQRLPEPEGLLMGTGKEYVAPHSEIEKRLASIWEQVLGREGIGMKDDFFELGGHSLKLMQLAGLLHREFETKIAIKDLFRNRTAEDQVQLINKSRRTVFTPIASVPGQFGYKLSSAQHRLWVLCQLGDGHIAYNMNGFFLMEGDLQPGILSHCFNVLIARHEILRTVFRYDATGRVLQYVLEKEQVQFDIGYKDVRSGNSDNTSRKNILKEIAGNAYKQAFDLAQAPLLRSNLYQLEDSKWLLAFAMHHIISDGWSIEIMVQELATLYNAFVIGKEVELPPLKVQYKDYAEWQQEQLATGVLAIHKAYWLQQLQGELPVLQMPGDKSRPAIKTYNGGKVSHTIDNGLMQQLQNVCRREGVTFFMGLVTVVNALLYRYTGQEDIILGTPVAGRQHPDLHGQIGFFVNMLPLRLRFRGDDSFLELLSVVKEITLEAYEHQQYPFDELVNDLDVQRDLSRSPVFDAVIVYQSADAASTIPHLHQMAISKYEEEDGQMSKYDLLFSFVEADTGLALHIEYNSDIYSKTTVNKLAIHLDHLLHAVLDSPKSSLATLDYLSEDEKHTLLTKFNDTQQEYPCDKTIVDLFEAQVKSTPDHIAVVYNETALTFRSLNEQCNRLAHYLRENYNIQPDELVGVQLHRSEKMIISILGVLKSGAAYIPIDPGYPQERINYMLSNSNCKLVIDEQELKKFYQVADLYTCDDPVTVNNAGHLAYVIYTSGSTGRPKGVMIEHNGVINRIAWMWHQYRFSADDIILQKTTFTFDVSVWEIFMPLCFGAKMVLCSEETAGSPLQIASLIQQHAITCLHFVPGMLQAFINSFSKEEAGKKLESIRLLITSGEALLPETVKSWHGLINVPIHNLYGPTEASVDVTYYVTSPHDVKVPIGRPIWNTQIYILSESNQLMPIGVPGEICIGGVGVARGYLNQVELTTARFVPDPFRDGKRMYRTGDAGRWLPDGNIEFIGRKDNQVKIRGYRIEPGEIEAVLVSWPGVHQCVVMVHEHSQGTRLLIGYYVSAEQLDEDEMLLYLGSRLPEYMVPTMLVHIKQLPLTASGKLNRMALPQPDLLNSNNYVPPGNETEVMLCQLYGEVLALDGAGISVYDDFFRLGGDSLTSIRLVNRINKMLGTDIPVISILRYKTIRQLSQYIKEKTTQNIIIYADPVNDPEQQLLSFAQERLWFLMTLEKNNAAYNIPIVFKLQEEVHVESFLLAWRTIVQRHEVLRTVISTSSNGIGYQQVMDDNERPLVVHRMNVTAEAALHEAIDQSVRYVFRLHEEYPVRVCLFTFTAEQRTTHYMSIVFHHIAMDGWSIAIFMREMVNFYAYHEAIRKGDTETAKKHDLQLPDLQYKEYALWQRKYLTAEELEGQLSYWKNKLSGFEQLRLPVDKPRPEKFRYEGSGCHFSLNIELSRDLRLVARELEVSLFSVLLSGYYLLLRRYSGQQDIVIGTPVANRHHRQVQDTIGFFVNSLALREYIDVKQGLDAFIRQVSQSVNEAQLHQDLPFEMLVEAMNIERDTSRHPIFQVIFDMQRFTDDQHKAIGSLLELYEGMENYWMVKFDLNLTIDESGDGLAGKFRYATSIYEPDTIQRYITTYIQILTQIASLRS